jgi:hypothetical protein
MDEDAGFAEWKAITESNLCGESFGIPGVLDRLSKCLSPCPAAEQPHWLRQPLARY